MAELTEPTDLSGLTDLVADVLRTPAAEVTEETGPATTAAWTSLRHVQIVSRVEQTYGIRLTAREVRACRSVGALRAVLTAKRGTP
ncbi:acyl carrier protein [Streptomyces griseus]|uniref:acyl carrier protein n=1 Tax=Streptomyces griseus TaxID=1911 RepID=UPI00083FF5F6|nr:acyl carrier protein [Streptomyces griseus]